MSRGRYAGPVGWCTPDGDGEFAIALRCAEVRGERARLFAGAGIVQGSLPEGELTETWLKLRAMTGVLGA
jgi:isochorismate synthase EntC